MVEPILSLGLQEVDRNTVERCVGVLLTNGFEVQRHDNIISRDQFCTYPPRCYCDLPPGAGARLSPVRALLRAGLHEPPLRGQHQAGGGLQVRSVRSTLFQSMTTCFIVTG